jgi:hypothetical protein
LANGFAQSLARKLPGRPFFSQREVPLSNSTTRQLPAIRTSKRVSAESKPVSTIEQLKIRILKIRQLRFTGQNAGSALGKR